MSVHKYTTAKGPRWSVAYSRPDGTCTQKRGFLTKTAAKAWETKLVSYPHRPVGRRKRRETNYRRVGGRVA